MPVWMKLRVSPAMLALSGPDKVTEFRPTELTLSPAVLLGLMVSTTISPTCTPALEVKVMLDEFRDPLAVVEVFLE